MQDLQGQKRQIKFTQRNKITMYYFASFISKNFTHSMKMAFLDYEIPFD